MEDCLIIGIDIENKKDISCMTVARKNGDEIQVLNHFYNDEAEDIYYKLININTRMEYPEMINNATKRNMENLRKFYSYKEILETIEYTQKLRSHEENERNFILDRNTPRKIVEILAVFWVTHSNDEFFDYFGFSWVPSVKVLEKAKEIINNHISNTQEEILTQTLRKPIEKNSQNSIDTNKIMENLGIEITKSSYINPIKFLNDATK